MNMVLHESPHMLNQIKVWGTGWPFKEVAHYAQLCQQAGSNFGPVCRGIILLKIDIVKFF